MPLLANRLSRMILAQRLVQKVLRRPLDIRQSWAETPQKFENLVEFLNWFDTTDSIENCLQKAQSDWEFRFHRSPYFASTPKGAALEIGFGGGRLLAQASKDFEQVFGVDIHENFGMTRKFLDLQNVQNATLIHRNNLHTLPDSSIDFVYSFIVFQHFDSMEEVAFYLGHINRLLTPQGVAHIYFGKSKTEDVQVTGSDNFHLRDCSLFISPAMMRQKIATDFDVLDIQETLPRDAITGAGESVQAAAIFKRKSE